jgi:cyclic beta-1,2-glucan synthetase
MWRSWLLSVAAALATMFLAHALPWVAFACASVWFFAPLVARGVSLPIGSAGRAALNAEEARRVRSMARQTWSYFDTFVTAEQNHLPPDNFQEVPLPVLAHRTSPTNLGLYLLAVVSAREFGWIGTTDAVERLEATFATLDRLERFRGHFFNWYDTQDLRPLDPKYISTVDSGNLAGHLLTLEGACAAWLASPLPHHARVGGVLDSLDQMQDVVGQLAADERRSYGVSPAQLIAAIDTLRRHV